MPNFRTLHRLAGIGLAIAIGAAGGALARLIGAPMPWLLGAFVASGIAMLGDLRLGAVRPDIPMPLRNLFVAVIGVMIGGSFHPDFARHLGGLWLPGLGIILFVVVAHAMNFVLFRRAGGLDRTTAYYAAMPGGLIESIAFGERAGGDVQAVSLQQFARIALVITLLPLLFQLVTGAKVGSAAGVSLTPGTSGIEWWDWAILIFCALAGLFGGKALRLPASILVGPMILSAIAHYFGLISVGPPGWLIASAQVIVGAGIGARFRGFEPARVGRAFGLALISVSAMLLLGAGMSLVLTWLIDLPFEVLFISFAPGGVTETALIALSLDANPILVTTLHVFRILLTVAIATATARFFIRPGG